MKMYLATLLLSSYGAISAMYIQYQLPSEEIIKDRTRYKIQKHFGNSFGTNIGYNFIETTDLHNLANQHLAPLLVASYATGAAGKFCALHMTEEHSLNLQKPLEQIILRELLKDHPRAIEALQNNYDIFPRRIK
jgi:hypothetical protein